MHHPRSPLLPTNTTLAILAGGEGSRMGRPKALLTLNGLPILQYLIERLRWPGPTMLVTAPGRETPPGKELFDEEVVDPIAGQGPLRGVLTALEHARTSVVVVATVDMPLIGREQLELLLARLNEDIVGVMTRRHLETGERIEPFPSAFRVEAVEWVRARLSQGRESVHGLSENAAVRVVEAPIEWRDDVWTNLNRPADLEAHALKQGDLPT